MLITIFVKRLIGFQIKLMPSVKSIYVMGSTVEMVGLKSNSLHIMLFVGRVTLDFGTLLLPFGTLFLPFLCFLGVAV